MGSEEKSPMDRVEPMWSPSALPLWNSDQRFVEIMQDGVNDVTLVDVPRCYTLYQFAKSCLRLDGQFLEIGVYKGGTAFLLASLLQDTNKVFIGCDTFNGMPPTREGTDEHQEGDFADTSYESVCAHLRGLKRVALLQGLFPDCAQDVLSKNNFAFVHVDVDIYDSVLRTCEAVYPRLSKGAVMVFDDYGFPQCAGAKQAVDEFFDSRSLPTIYLPTGQCVVINA